MTRALLNLQVHESMIWCSVFGLFSALGRNGVSFLPQAWRWSGWQGALPCCARLRYRAHFSHCRASDHDSPGGSWRRLASRDFGKMVCNVDNISEQMGRTVLQWLSSCAFVAVAVLGGA